MRCRCHRSAGARLVLCLGRVGTHSGSWRIQAPVARPRKVLVEKVRTPVRGRLGLEWFLSEGPRRIALGRLVRESPRWRARCRRPRNVACQLSIAYLLKGAPYTCGKRDQEVIESTTRIDIDLCNYRQKPPYVIARKTRGAPHQAT
jgi:hypothetical protein